MKEKFVRINTIEGYNNIKDYYYISNSDEDKIMNKNTGKILKIKLSDRGYKVVNLMTKDGKIRTCSIHVLKARAFIYTPNPLGYNVVRHLNDVKTDNRLENLTWGTQSDNMKDCVKNGNFNYEASAKNFAKGRTKGNAVSAKKTSKPVRCLETDITYPSASEAERQTGIANSSINKCCRGKLKTSSGYHWQFVDKQEYTNKEDVEEVK